MIGTQPKIRDITLYAIKLQRLAVAQYKVEKALADIALVIDNECSREFIETTKSEQFQVGQFIQSVLNDLKEREEQCKAHL